MEDYFNKQREWMEKVSIFPYEKYSYQYLTPETMKEMLDKLYNTFGFITGGYTLMVEEGKCLYRT